MSTNVDIFIYIPEQTVPFLICALEDGEGDRDLERLFSEIYENYPWSTTETVLLEGNYPYENPASGTTEFRPVQIRNDKSFKKFADLLARKNIPLSFNIKRIDNNIGSSSRSNPPNIGSSSRSNPPNQEIDEPVMNETPVINEPVMNQPLTYEPVMPEYDDRQIDEEDVDEDEDGNEDEDEDEVDEEPPMNPEDMREYFERKYTYDEEVEMASVGNFGYAPAKEFETCEWEVVREEISDGLDAIEQGILFEKQVFKSKSTLQTAIKYHCVKTHREMYVDRSNKTVYTILCMLDKHTGCAWRLHASKNRQDLWQIKKFRDRHTCWNETILTNHRQLSSTLVASLVIDLVRSDLSIKPVTIIAFIKANPIGYTISYWKAWSAKQHAIKFLFGDWQEAYNLLPALMRSIKETNPDVHYQFKPVKFKSQTEVEFEGLFWAFGQCVKGFRYCRPVITIDGTFLTGKYKGCLLTAIGMDGEGHLYPVAFALVEKESGETWTWFMGCLKRCLGGIHNELCIISDRHKGIIQVMKSDEWKEPFGYHRYCMRHVQQNLSDSRGLKDKSVVPMAACLIKAHTTHEFEKILGNIKEKDKAAFNWFKEIDKNDKGRHKYALAYDEGGRRWGLATSNNAEIMNMVFLGIRKLPVTAIVLGTFYKINQYRVKRRLEADQREGPICAELRKEMDDLSKKAETWEVNMFNPGGGNETGVYQVTTNIGRIRQFQVNIDSSNTIAKCECQIPTIYHKPCAHVMAVIRFLSASCTPFIHPCYGNEYYKKTYENFMHPIKDKEFWKITDRVKILPGRNLVREEKGRRKIKRYKNGMDKMFNEPPRAKNCSNCKEAGHTRPTCTKTGGGKDATRTIPT